MKGNFAPSILCSLGTSVDFGWYSSMVGVGFCDDCFCNDSREAVRCVAAVWGLTVAKITAARIATRNAGARQDLIVRLGNGPAYLPTRRRNDVWLAVVDQGQTEARPAAGTKGCGSVSLAPTEHAGSTT